MYYVTQMIRFKTFIHNAYLFHCSKVFFAWERIDEVAMHVYNPCKWCSRSWWRPTLQGRIQVSSENAIGCYVKFAREGIRLWHVTLVGSGRNHTVSEIFRISTDNLVDPLAAVLIWACYYSYTQSRLYAILRCIRWAGSIKIPRFATCLQFTVVNRHNLHIRNNGKLIPNILGGGYRVIQLRASVSLLSFRMLAVYSGTNTKSHICGLNKWSVCARLLRDFIFDSDLYK